MQAGAWKAALELPDSVFSGQSPAGNGNSRVNTLHWIATRPDASCDAEESTDGHVMLQQSAPAIPEDGFPSIPRHFTVRIASIFAVMGAVVVMAMAATGRMQRLSETVMFRLRVRTGAVPEGSSEILLTSRDYPLAEERLSPGDL